MSKLLRLAAAATLFVAVAAAPPPKPQPGAAEARPAAAAPRPAMWLLEDHDTKIYLFGTIHILPPGFKWRSAALDRAVDNAGELVVETYQAPGGDAYGEAAALFMQDEPTPILDRVPAEKREALATAIETSGLPAMVYDSMHTWAAAVTLGLAHLLGDYGVDVPSEAPGVEDVLEQLFVRAGKPIGSIEDFVGVLEGMNALPQAEQSELLVQSVAEAAKGQQDEDVDAWVAGRVDRMALIEGKDLPPAMYDVLIRKRNAAWTEWLARRLERPGTVLLAVGAGHLAGPDSVQRMLAVRGLDARRID